MSETTIYIRATRAEVRQAISRIPEAAMGGDSETKSMANAMMTRCGMALLGRIRRAFVAKSRGGADESGLSWKPLSKATIAYSRRHPGLPTVRTGRRPSYALTDAQRKRWWQVYRQQLARFKGDKGSAARNAWAILKREGATTLMDKYGGTQVEILRDTGLLLNSLSPGIGGSSDRVFRVGNGEVIVGTNRKWAAVHHEGSRDGRIPQRRLWPEPRNWPASWWLDITEQAKAGLVDIAEFLIKRSNE